MLSGFARGTSGWPARRSCFRRLNPLFGGGRRVVASSLILIRFQAGVTRKVVTLRRPIKGCMARRGNAYHAAIRGLYHERLVSLQCALGGGPDAMHIERAKDMPGWFRAVELGFAIGEGPSIEQTHTNLAEINRRNRAQLAE